MGWEATVTTNNRSIMGRGGGEGAGISGADDIVSLCPRASTQCTLPVHFELGRSLNLLE